jgi:septal ring factor EnvC (AmiA/AmiB activator)
MDKALLKESIKSVEESIKVSKDNLKKAEQHIAEGELILKAFREQLKLFG